MTTDYDVTTKFLVVVMTQRMSLIQVDPKFVELIAFHRSICPLSWLIALWEVTRQYHLPRCHIASTARVQWEVLICKMYTRTPRNKCNAAAAINENRPKYLKTRHNTQIVS